MNNSLATADCARVLPPDAGRSLMESGRHSDKEASDALEQLLAKLDGHIQPRH